MLELNYSQPSFYEETPICYFQTASGLRLNLTNLCKQGARMRGGYYGGPEVIDPRQYSEQQPNYSN
jgi:hypothetical protein